MNAIGEILIRARILITVLRSNLVEIASSLGYLKQKSDVTYASREGEICTYIWRLLSSILSMKKLICMVV